MFMTQKNASSHYKLRREFCQILNYILKTISFQKPENVEEKLLHLSLRSAGYFVYCRSDDTLSRTILAINGKKAK